MATSETYRMGDYLIGEHERPSLEELAESLDDEFIDRDDEELDDGTILDYKDKGRNVWVQETEDGSKDDYDYCHFRYVSDTKDSYRERTESDEEEDQNDTRLVEARVMYFRNGQFAFESKNNLENSWIPRFIGRATGYDIEGSDYQLYHLGEEYMHDVYDHHDIVTKLQLKEPRSEPDKVSGDIVEFIRNLAGEVNSFEFTANNEGNLKERESLDTCARNLRIHNIKAKYENDYMKEINSSSLTKRWDAGAVTPEGMEAQVVRESLAVRSAVQEELERLKRIYS